MRAALAREGLLAYSYAYNKGLLMILPKIKQWCLALFGGKGAQANQPSVDEALSPQLKREVEALAQRLNTQRVSVRELAKDEVIPDEPQLGDAPLKD